MLLCCCTSMPPNPNPKATGAPVHMRESEGIWVNAVEMKRRPRKAVTTRGMKLEPEESYLHRTGISLWRILPITTYTSCTWSSLMTMPGIQPNRDSLSCFWKAKICRILSPAGIYISMSSNSILLNIARATFSMTSWKIFMGNKHVAEAVFGFKKHLIVAALKCSCKFFKPLFIKSCDLVCLCCY